MWVVVRRGWWKGGLFVFGRGRGADCLGGGVGVVPLVLFSGEAVSIWTGWNRSLGNLARGLELGGPCYTRSEYA